MSPAKRPYANATIENDSKVRKTDGSAAADGMMVESNLCWLLDFILQNDECDAWLDPMDLVRLIHVCKMTRWVVAPALNKLEEEVIQTRGHSDIFRRFLHQPRITHSNPIWEEMMAPENDDLCGPLRLGVIKDLASRIEKRFAILQYTKSYDCEESLVALFDDNGAFLAFYEFSSEQYYQCLAGYIFDRRLQDEVLSNHDPQICLGSSGYLHFADFPPSANTKWRGLCQACIYFEPQYGYSGEHVTQHYILINSFLGILSPLETFFCLMHALSSDTRSIYICTKGFFQGFAYDLKERCYDDYFPTADDDFDELEGMDSDEEFSMMDQWQQKLEQLKLSYRVQK